DPAPLGHSEGAGIGRRGIPRAPRAPLRRRHPRPRRDRRRRGPSRPAATPGVEPGGRRPVLLRPPASQDGRAGPQHHRRRRGALRRGTAPGPPGRRAGSRGPPARAAAAAGRSLADADGAGWRTPMRRPLGGRRPHGAAAPLDLRPVDPRSGDPQVPSSSDVSRPARLPSRWYVVPLLVVAAAAMAHAVTGGGGGDAGPRGFGGDERAPPGWQRGAVGPLRSRVGHVSVWTGSELVVWGGEPAADGAAYNPSTASWRRIRPAPFPASTGAASAWTGFELLVWGGDTGGPRAVVTANGGAYDIGADVWRRLSPAPLTARRPLAAAWTGERFVVVGGTTGDGEWLADGAAYDPQSNRWTAVAPLPIAFRQAVAMWTGQELVVFGTTSDDPAKSTAVAWHPASD